MKLTQSRISDYRLKMRKREFKTSFRQVIATYLFEYKGTFVFTVVLSIIQAMLFLVVPIFANLAIDSLAAKQWDQLVNTFLWMLLFVVIHGLVMFYRLWLNNTIGNSIIYNLRNDLFVSIQQQSYKFLDNNRTGDLMSRTTADVNLLKTLMSSQLAFFIRQLLQFVLTFVIMFVISPQLAPYILFFMPFAFVVMFAYRLKIGPAFTRARKTYGSLTSVLQENVNGVRVVRAFGREKEEHRKFEVENEKYYGDMLKVARYQAIFQPTIRLLNFSMMIIIILVGGKLAYEGEMTFGNLFAFILLMNFSLGPLEFIAQFLGDLSKIGVACDRVTDILNSREVIPEKPDARELPPIRGEIEFDHVWFSYLKDGHYELRDVSFRTKPGETIAILGSTGSGKTTLVNLLSRFYDVDKGRITIDGFDVRDVTKKSLRRQIGMVAQETILFGETLRENIAKGQPWRLDDTDAIIHAAKLAQIHDFIDSLPEKYETLVGERGVTLSGGQKQRVSIARAIFMEPRILVLDDATSAVDVDTEFEIQEHFAEMFQNCTTFFITQRLSTVRNADRILVLEHGEIREEGSHEELVERDGGIYARLYKTLKVEERL
ncbi:MAG: ABC transporter ATP-binding protein [Promethearchaeota archaeon]